eukprot:1791499-Pyramimonas_sp.AAC.1
MIYHPPFTFNHPSIHPSIHHPVIRILLLRIFAPPLILHSSVTIRMPTIAPRTKGDAGWGGAGKGNNDTVQISS